MSQWQYNKSVHTAKFQQPLVIREKKVPLIEALKELNRQSVPQGTSPFDFDIGITMTVIAGNPANCRFDFAERSDGGISIRFLKHEPDTAPVIVARGELYKDYLRGSLNIDPYIIPNNRRLGLGIALYVAAARVLHITGNGPLSSNHHPGQLTPSARELWEDLAKNRVAVKKGENSYEFSSAVSGSQVAQTWLSRIIRYATFDAMLERSPMRKLAGVAPSSLLRFGKFVHLMPAPDTAWSDHLLRKSSKNNQASG